MGRNDGTPAFRRITALSILAAGLYRSERLEREHAALRRASNEVISFELFVARRAATLLDELELVERATRDDRIELSEVAE